MLKHIRPVRALLAALCAAAVVALALNRGFYDSSLLSVYFSLTAASILLVHLSIRPLTEALYVLACTGALVLLQFRFLSLRPRVVPVLGLAGLSSLLALALNAIWRTGEQRRLTLYALVSAFLFTVSEWSAADLLALTERLHPKTFDLFLYSFDASLRIQPAFKVGQWFAAFPWLRAVSLLFYIALPVPLALVFGRHLKARGRSALPVMLAFLITGPLGVVLYNLLPANGPRYVFESFPAYPLSIAQAARLKLETIAAAGPRNAIPSLHMAWMLLAWWNSEGLSRLARLFVMACLLFTVLATMGTGEHYLVDLVVAFPFALSVQALSGMAFRRSEKRREVLLAGVLLTLGWFALLSFGVRMAWASPVVPWALSIATMAAVVVLQHRLSTDEHGAIAQQGAECGGVVEGRPEDMVRA